jgi:hypothetical protein
MFISFRAISFSFFVDLFLWSALACLIDCLFLGFFVFDSNYYFYYFSFGNAPLYRRLTESEERVVFLGGHPSK